MILLRSFRGAIRGAECRLRALAGGQPPLATASVGAGQGLYGRYRDFLVVHGKEKVYGSIP
jgi:hypothetical protein